MYTPFQSKLRVGAFLSSAPKFWSPAAGFDAVAVGVRATPDVLLLQYIRVAPLALGLSVVGIGGVAGVRADLVAASRVRVFLSRVSAAA